MKRLLAVAVAALVVAGVATVPLVLDDDVSQRPPPAARPATAPEGSLRVGVPGLPATYNPFDIRSRTPDGLQILGMVLPQLFDVAPDGTVRGRLVDDETVEVLDASVRFELVDGARWSDGPPITARDLAFTLDVVRSDPWPGPSIAYADVAAVQEVDGVVEMAFDDRVPPGWQRLFSGPDFVLPAHRLGGRPFDAMFDEWATGPDVAGGPYELVGSTPGLDVVLTANPEWWGDGPGVRDVRVVTVPDATTLQQLFERGELDVIWMPAYTERVEQMRRIEGADVATAPPGGRLVSVYVRAGAADGSSDVVGRVGVDTGPVDEDVRRAALDLVDRDRFVSVLLAGEAELATSWGRVESDPGWPQWSVDLEPALQLGSRQEVFAVAEEEPMAALLVRAVQRRARSTDMTLDSVRVLSERLDGEWLADGAFDLAVVDEQQWPEPCWRCRWASETIGETNWSRVADLDGLAAAADRGEPSAAVALERELETRGVVLPLWRPGAVVVSRNVDGVSANSWNSGPFDRVEAWTMVGAGGPETTSTG